MERKVLNENGTEIWGTDVFDQTFLDTGDHCKTPRRRHDGKRTNIRCVHIAERCERCVPGKHTGDRYGTSVSDFL